MQVVEARCGAFKIANFQSCQVHVPKKRFYIENTVEARCVNFLGACTNKTTLLHLALLLFQRLSKQHWTTSETQVVKYVLSAC